MFRQSHRSKQSENIIISNVPTISKVHWATQLESSYRLVAQCYWPAGSAMHISVGSRSPYRITSCGNSTLQDTVHFIQRNEEVKRKREFTQKGRGAEADKKDKQDAALNVRESNLSKNIKRYVHKYPPYCS